MPTDLERVVEVLKKANPGLSDKIANLLASELLWSPLTAKELNDLANWHDPDFVFGVQQEIVSRNVKRRGRFYVIFANGFYEGESCYVENVGEEEDEQIQRVIEETDRNELLKLIWESTSADIARHLALELSKPRYTLLGISEDLRRGDSFCVSVLKSPVCSCIDVSFMKIEKDHLC